MSKPEQYDSMPGYTELELAEAKQFLDRMLQTLTAGVIGLVVVHKPEGTPGFYAAAAKILSDRNPKFPADFLYPRIRTFRDMQKAGYGPIEVIGIMSDNFQAFLDGDLHGEPDRPDEDQAIAEDGLTAAVDELNRARLLLHTNPQVDIGLMVLRVALTAERGAVDVTAAAIALSEMFSVYGPYRPDFLKKAIVQCQATVDEGGAANLGTALRELIVTFCIEE